MLPDLIHRLLSGEQSLTHRRVAFTVFFEFSLQQLGLIARLIERSVSLPALRRLDLKTHQPQLEHNPEGLYKRVAEHQ